MKRMIKRRMKRKRKKMKRRRRKSLAFPVRSKDNGWFSNVVELHRRLFTRKSERFVNENILKILATHSLKTKGTEERKTGYREMWAYMMEVL